MEEKVEKIEKPDRMLGDEWEDWTGDLDEGIEYNESAGLFVRFAVFSLFAIAAVAGFALYMIEPRLALIHPMLVIAARFFMAALIIAFFGWALLVIISAVTGRKLPGSGRMAQVTATRLLPWTLAMARRLGISRDRFGNSFVSFSNAIVKASHTPGKGRTIILLPRCLNVDMKKEVQALAEKAGGQGLHRDRRRPGT